MNIGTDFDRPEAGLQPSPAVFALLEEGLDRQRAGDGQQARQRYQAALQAAIEHGDRPGQARALGQLAALAEGGGAILAAQEANRQATELFLALGDGGGLVQSYRLSGFIHLRLGEIEQAATDFARAMALALQLDVPQVATTLNQIVPVARYLVKHSQTAGLLPLGAAMAQAVQQVTQERGTWPPEMADFAEIVATVGGVFSPLGLMASEPDLDASQRRRLAARSTHQAWWVDALTRRRWELADFVELTLQQNLDFHEPLD